MFKYSFISKIRLQICGNMKVKPFFNFYISYQVGNDMFKVEKKNSRFVCRNCSNLITKKPES